MKSKSTEITKNEYLNAVICDKIEFLMDYFNIQYKNVSDSIVCACPVHGGDNRTAVNLFMSGHTRVGNWVCYTHHCENTFINTSIGFFRGVMSNKKYGWSKVGDRTVSFSDTIASLCGLLKIDLSSIKDDVPSHAFDKHAHLFTTVKKQKEFLYTKKVVRERLDIPSKYFVSRGYSANILDMYDIGESKSDNRFFRKRAVVPVYDSDNKTIVGFTGRTILDKCSKCSNFHENESCDPQNAISKWIHNKGFSKKNYLYNFGNAKDEIKKTGIVILVEGPADVWKFVENGIHNVVAVFGSSLTDTQQVLLESSGATTLILLFDSDKAGNNASNKLNSSLSRMFKIVCPSLPDGIKDPGDLSNEQINNMIKPLIERNSY